MKSKLFLVTFVMVCMTSISLYATCQSGFSWIQTANNVISFTNTSTGTSASTHYTWAFGDGNHSSTQNPVHTYSIAGTYSVCMHIADSISSCSSYFCDTVVVTGCSVAIGCYQYHIASCPTCADGIAHSYASNGTAPYTYSWSTTPVQTTASATGLLPGNYTVCAIDANGCHACCVVTITDSIACNMTMGCYQYHIASCSTCADGVAHGYASNGTAPYAYSWSTTPVQTTSVATGLLPGNYTVCATDAHNCHACCIVTVTDSVSCSLTVGCYNYHPASCATCADGVGHAYASNGTAPYTYSWSTNPVQTTASATGLLPGNYTVCVTDAHNCHACCVVNVTYTVGCNMNLGCYQYHQASCAICADGMGHAYVSNGTAPYAYSWSTTPVQTTPSATGLAPGNYSVCVTDAHGCMACCIVTITYTPHGCQAYFYLFPDTSIAHTYWAINYTTSNNTPITYTWNWGDSTTSTGAYPSHTYPHAGVYHICLTTTDAVGCSSTFCRTDSLQRNSNYSTNSMLTVNVISPDVTDVSLVNAPTSFATIYPIPNNGSFILSYHLSASKSQLQITDIIGRVIYTSSITGNEGTQNISVNDLKNSIYYWQIISADSVLDKGKIVVIR